MVWVLPTLSATDLSDPVTIMQGPIALLDYLRTRCIEAVVHGCDLVPPIRSDATLWRSQWSGCSTPYGSAEPTW